jgi:RNA polymerase sigma-70 factor (ECF subfamily)
MPTIRQDGAANRLFNALVNRRIPRFASHFQAVFVARSRWHTDCFFNGGRCATHLRWRIAFMETSLATCKGNDTDSELVAAAKCGDTRAFEKLVSRYEARVLAVAQRITNNREDAEDAAQESFHKAFLHLDSFQEKARFSTWLTRIAMNEALMMLRRRRGSLEVLPERDDDGVNAASEAFVDQRPTPEESCWRRERRELLTAAINRLRPTIRRTMMLRDIEERSVEETARILGTSISAVKARLFYGRQRLRQTVNSGFLRGIYLARRAQTQRF